MSKTQRYRRFAEDAKKWAKKRIHGSERRY